MLAHVPLPAKPLKTLGDDLPAESFEDKIWEKEILAKGGRARRVQTVVLESQMLDMQERSKIKAWLASCGRVFEM